MRAVRPGGAVRAGRAGPRDHGRVRAVAAASATRDKPRAPAPRATP